MFKMQIAVACRNAFGLPELPVFTVISTPTGVAMGRHLREAEQRAESAGYERPFICFDAVDQASLVKAARSLGLVPRVVVIDASGGLVNSVRCDAGELAVVCYDEKSTHAAPDEELAELPVGDGGKSTRCWAQVQLAVVDPGLKRIRV